MVIRNGGVHGKLTGVSWDFHGSCDFHGMLREFYWILMVVTLLVSV